MISYHELIGNRVIDFYFDKELSQVTVVCDNCTYGTINFHTTSCMVTNSRLINKRMLEVAQHFSKGNYLETYQDDQQITILVRKFIYIPGKVLSVVTY